MDELMEFIKMVEFTNWEVLGFTLVLSTTTAILILLSLRNKDKFSHEIHSLLQSPDKKIRLGALDRVEKHKNIQTVELILQEALKSPYLDVRDRVRGIIQNRGLLKKYITQLKSSDEGKRKKAIQILGQLEDPTITRMLITEFLINEKPEIDNLLIKTIGAMDPESVITALLGVTEELEDIPEDKVVNLVSEVGSRNPEIITGLLDSREEKIRFWAVMALAKIKDGRASIALVNALKDPSERVRTAVCSSLGERGESMAIQPLLEALRDSRKMVREAAALSLSKVGDERVAIILIDQLLKEVSRSEDEGTIERLVQTIFNINKEAGELLLEKLKDKEKLAKAKIVDILERFGLVKRYIEDLKSPDEERKRKALTLLGIVGEAKSVPSLINALYHPDTEVRKATIDVLRDSSDPVAINSLIGVLNDHNPKLRAKAAKTLGKLRATKAVDPLFAALNDPASEVRAAAAWALGQIRSAKIVEPKLKQLKEEDKYDQAKISWELGMISQETVASRLFQAMSDPVEDVQIEVMEALGEIRAKKAVPHLVDKALYGPTERVRKAAVKALEENIDEDGITQILQALKDSDWEIRMRAIEVLERVGSQRAVNPLIGMLRDSNDKIRAKASRALYSLAEKISVITPLVNHLQDPDPRVRSGIAGTLGNIRAEEAIRPLVNALSDPNKFVRASIVNALKKMKALSLEAYTESFLDLLRDPDSFVRARAVELLAKIGNSEAIEGIIDALKDPDEEVRKTVMREISQIADERMVDPLINVLGRDEKLRGELVKIAASLGEKVVDPLVEVTKKEEKMRPFILHVLKYTPAVNKYISQLNDLNPNRRIKAVEALGILKDKTAALALISLLESDPVPAVRASAVQALGGMKDIAQVRRAIEKARADLSYEVSLIATQILEGKIPSPGIQETREEREQ